jgi:hypothetical protein
MKKNVLLIVLLLWHLGLYAKGNEKTGMDKQPLLFQENKGQIRNQQGEIRTDIDFILKTKDVTLFIGKGQLHYQYIKEEEQDATVYSKTNTPKQYKVPGGATLYRVDVSLLNSDKNAVVQKEEPQQSQFHYYNVPDEAAGTTNVHACKKIVYQNIYPNIDWVLYTKGNEFKYDFVVRPGGKVSDIQMKYDGASSIKLLSDGSLDITTPLGSLKEEAPYSYNADNKQKISSRFVLKDNTVSFKTGSCKNTLVIDPGVKWATYFGGTLAEGATNMAVDKDGYIYICGLTQSNNNIATTGAHQTARGGGNNDAFLAKFDTLGQLQWATYYGGTGTGSPLSGAEINVNVSCDAFGHVYLAGTTLSATNIATTNGFQNSINPVPAGLNGANGFLVQFNSSGVRQWGTYYGASSKNTKFWSVANDNFGNVYVAGDADSSNSLTGALVTPGTHQTTYGGGDYDGLIVKFDSTGQRKWATYYGGNKLDDVNSLICDNAGNVFITGITFDSPNGIATAGTHEPTWVAAAEGFLAKFDSTGQRLWGTYLHGKGQDLALDPFNHLYVGGHTQASTADSFIVTAGCHQGSVELGSQHNGFLMQFNPDNGTRNWGTFYGAEFTTMGYTLACDTFGNVFFGGDTKCYATLTTETIATTGSHQDTLGSAPGLPNPPTDAFVVQFDSFGHRKWATYYGGTAGDGGKAVACDLSGALYLAGGSSSTTAIATAGTYQSTIGGSGDAFLVRMLPVDMTIKGLVNPDNDTICSGETPLAVWVENQGRMNKTDTVFISYSYTGPANGNLDTFFTDDLLAGTSDTLGLGNIDFQFPGQYNVTVYLHYTRNDSEHNNDTLHFDITVTNALPVADINVSQVGTVFHFSNNNAQPSDQYQWNFGDGDISTEPNPSHEYDVTGTYTVTLIVTNFCGADTATAEVEGIGTSNGINEPGNNKVMYVYPNPADQMLYLKVAAGTVFKEYSISNVLGQRVQQGQLKGESAIALHNLAQGAYFIKVSTDKGWLVRQFRILRR